MISINPLKTKVLITVDEVIFHGPTDNTVDPRSILQSIIIAESRFIKPLIGLTAYNKIAAVKNVLVTESNLETYRTQVNENRPKDREDRPIQAGDYVNSDTFLNSTQLVLWSDHLHKLTAECVIYTALVNNRARFTAKGVTKNSPNLIMGGTDTQSLDLFELKHMMDKTLWHRIGPLIDDMHGYMCKEKYPDYTRACDCDGIGTDLANRTGLILSMYDDDERCGCDWKDFH
jgi:hypothetical protein